MTRRLVAGLLIFAAIVLALLVVPLGISGQRGERDRLNGQLERDAMAAAAIAVELLDPSGDISASARGDALRARLAEYARRGGGRIVVVDAAGASVVDTGEPERPVRLGRDFSTRPEVAAAMAGRITSGERGSDTLGHQLLFVAAPVTSAGELRGAVRISHPSHELDERIKKRWIALASMSAVVLAVALLLALLVGAWISRPLRRIAAVADDVGRGDLTVRSDVHRGPAEVRAVATRLNSSIEAVEGMLRDQRAFTADASHQLRTPLHALTLRLDNAVAELDADNVDLARTNIQRAAEDVARMAGLVQALLVLERADRDAAGSLTAIDLAGVVEHRLDDWTERADRVGVRLKIDVPSPLYAMARDLHVEQVLDNYIDNALAASSDGQIIRVVGSKAGSRVELHVIDEGPGLPDDQLEQAFRRFHSGAERPLGHGRGGFGLGLAIVRRLAEIDGANVDLRHGSSRGIDAVVSYDAGSLGPLTSTDTATTHGPSRSLRAQ